jgi:DnaK suppressor protein
MSNDKRTRYSDEELEEFKKMIEKKIEEAQSQMSELRDQLTELNNSGDENKAGSFDDGASNWQREHINKLASRQQRFIRDLEHAMIRIKNKTYGICSVTGKLIGKQRLLLVPHATKTVEGKTQIGNKAIDKKKTPTVSGLETDLTDDAHKTKKIANSNEEMEIVDDGSYIEDFSEPQDEY